MSGDPYSKERQLARGERRYRRKVAPPKKWQAIIAEKGGPCRVCEYRDGRARHWREVQFHHLVPRVDHGDDVAENIVPLCSLCHHDVTVGHIPALQALAANLDDSERGYVRRKLGADGYSRLFGVPADA